MRLSSHSRNHQGTYRRRQLTGCLVALALATSAFSAPEASSSKDLLGEAAWEYSLDGGKSFVQIPPTLEPGAKLPIVCRTTFVLDSGDIFESTHPYAVAELTPGFAKVLLNGKEIRGPLRRMQYRTIPAIDGRWLKLGKNTLQFETVAVNKSVKHRKTFEAQATLKGLRPEALSFQTGPILGAAGDGLFTVTCRTNMPARVNLTVETAAGKSVTGTSPVGLFHRFRLTGLDGPWRRYELQAHREQIVKKLGVVRSAAPEANESIRFVALGDGRSNGDAWGRVAAAAKRAGPDFVVYGGDMVTNGLCDWQWDEEFFTPAKSLLATVPFYAVIGNHENNCPLFEKLFVSPSPKGLSRNWSQMRGEVLLIGIDGALDFSPASPITRWLEQVLAGSQAEYIFLLTHYPAWTSAGHGRLDDTGQPREKAIRQAQQVILPLLAKYRATAIIGGHDHCYERSEPPCGVTAITTGGAGAPLYAKAASAEAQNPHSKAFASKHHYCLFTVANGKCTMQVLTPEGDVIDSRTWSPRSQRATADDSATVPCAD